MSTPYKRRARDSPSRQLLWELNQLAISSQESFHAHLDREYEEREDLHKQALATAAEKHERVRQNAEIEKQRLEEEQRAKQRGQEEEQRAALEKQRLENELAERRREGEQARAADQHRRALAEVQRERDEIEARRRADSEHQDIMITQKLQEKQEADKRKREAARATEAKAKEDAIAAKAQPTPRNTTIATQSTSLSVAQQGAAQPTKNSQWEQEHDRYSQIHRQLKDLRKSMLKTVKERPELKQLGSMRRDITKGVGQLTDGRGANRKPLQAIIDTLKRALTLPEPQIDITHFLAHSPGIPIANTKSPAPMVYLLNIFSKAIIAQLIKEAGASPKRADAIGIVGSHIFALGSFRWEGISLIDILLAKMHVVAPALFGINGSEESNQGKTRLGWWREDGRSGGPFVPIQSHFERMTGLGAGFAALSLRNYEKAVVMNPFPESHYWETLAKITSVPPAAITQTHLVLLKALIENYETKFIGFYGGAAVAALKEALIELPARCQPSVANKSLAGLKGVLAREKKLFL